MLYWKKETRRIAISGIPPSRIHVYSNNENTWEIVLHKHENNKIDWKITATTPDDFTELQVQFFGDEYTENLLVMSFTTEFLESIVSICTKLVPIIPHFLEVQDDLFTVYKLTAGHESAAFSKK